MGSVGSYAFINAKVRAMRSFLLTEAVYRSLLAAKNAQETFTILTQTHYHHLVDRLGGEDPDTMEAMLLREEVHRLQVIKKNSKGAVLETISLFLDRYEVERLKAVLRARKESDDSGHPLFFEKIQYDINLEAIAKAESMTEVTDLLGGTPFKRVLDDSVKRAQNEPSEFQVELALDRDLVKRSWEATGGLPARDKTLSRRLLGLEIDLKNIDWINRFIKYYGFSQDKILELLLPYGGRLNRDALRRIASGERFEGLLGDLVKRVGTPSTGTAPAVAETGDGSDGIMGLAVFERFLYRALFEEAKRVYSVYPFSIGVVYGYFYLIRVETKNVRSILQGKYYGMPDEQIETLLVL